MHFTFSSEEKEPIKSARFVATTVSKADVDRAVLERDFDVVIFDEAIVTDDSIEVHFKCGVVAIHEYL